MPIKLERRLKTFFIHRRDLQGARVYRSTDQSIPTGTDTMISFNTVRFDTSVDGDIWVVGTPTRLTARRAGIYQITGNASIAANATGRRFLYILLNGTTAIGYMIVDAVSAGRTVMSLSTLYELAVGEYVELGIRQTSGDPLNAESLANYTPEFMMARVG